ncbi:hypothetical protein B7P43_G15233 [Cryptotermes secundus]|uniref:Non-homologous end-joining factor 1 n=1 Tax=Cryptotermes secundus TaxID=105785 RepID=A0A2J7QIV0_9NEOP|nr:hypothetical protein B7P43_G15233 [Cryptotermes secundus]
MWKHIRIEHNDYIIKKISMDGHHKVLLSSFVNMWGEEITSASLYQRCKCFNPLVEGDEETVSQWTLSQIHDKTNAQISIKECENAQVMEINSKLAGVPFTVKFYLKVMTSQEIYDEITLPLLLMVQQLQAQKHLLFDLLKKKDIEITEYKLEGAQLSRRKKLLSNMQMLKTVKRKVSSMIHLLRKSKRRILSRRKVYLKPKTSHFLQKVKQKLKIK